MGLLDKFRKKPVADLAEEVLGSITHLLGTKQTFGAWQKGMGLDDYSYANASEEIINKIVDDIVYNIQNYEKRFQLSSVKATPPLNPRSLCFELEGILDGKVQIFHIYLEKNRGAKITKA
jgi:predicted component of type VI protein secretion system